MLKRLYNKVYFVNSIVMVCRECDVKWDIDRKENLKVDCSNDNDSFSHWFSLSEDSLYRSLHPKGLQPGVE